MHRGYIKLWRCIQDSAVFNDAQTLQIWIWLLTTATWKPRKVSHGGKEIILKPGDVIVAERETAERLKMSKTTFRRKLLNLQKWQKVDREPKRYFTIISVMNWGTYQDDTNDNEAPSGPEVDRKWTKNKKLRSSEQIIEGPFYPQGD